MGSKQLYKGREHDRGEGGDWRAGGGGGVVGHGGRLGDYSSVGCCRWWQKIYLFTGRWREMEDEKERERERERHVCGV